MSMVIHELTGVQRDLLYALAGFERPSGLQVKRVLETYYGQEVSSGQLYPNLGTLVDAELVSKGQVDQRTNFYDLSVQGRESLVRKRAWEDQQLASMRLVID